MISHPSLKRGTEQTKKEQLFRFFHQLLHEYSISPYFFTFVLIVETLQIIYFAIHPGCCALWQVPGLSVVQSVLGYTAGSLAWQNSPPTILIAFNLIFLMISLLVMGIIAYEIKNTTTDGYMVSNFHELRLKLVHYTSTMFRTTFIIPLSSLQASSIAAFYQNTNTQTTTTLALAICSFLCCSTLVYLFLELAIDNSPFSKFSLAGPVTFKEKAKAIIKFVLGVVSALISTTCQTSSDRIHLIALILFTIALIYIAFLYFSEANLVCNLVRRVSVHSLATILSIFFMAILQKIVSPSQNITLMFMLIFVVMTNLGLTRLKAHRDDSLVFSVYKTLTSKTQILAYNYLMCQYIRDFYKDPLCLVKLEGIIQDHVLNCKKLDQVCKCRIVKQKIKHFGYIGDEIEASLQAPHWFQFMKSNLIFNTEKMSHLPEFHLLLSYIEKNILCNNFVSYVNLQRCSLKKLPLSIQFLIYHQKRVIQRALTAEDKKNNEKKQVDVNRFIQMVNIVDKFQSKILKSSLQHLDFWKGLNSRRKNKQIIMKQGNNLLQTVKECEQLYKLISQKYPHNLESIVIFSNYSKYILNNHELILKNRSHFNMIKKKLVRSIKISSEQEREKYSENSITGTIIISGQRSNVGIIKACTSKATNILKFAPYELIGQNVNTIMPAFIGHMHNQVLIKYLDQAQPQSNFVERCAPMLDKNNFMVLSRIMSKCVPSLINGLQIIGLFQKIKDTNVRHMNQVPRYMLYRCDNGNIQALSQNFHTYYGYRLMKVSQFSEISEQLNFNNIFQDINNGDIRDGEEGIECQIKFKKNPKKTVRVKVYKRIELTYFGTKVRLLSIYSANQGNFNGMLLQNAMTINPNATQVALSQRSNSEVAGQTHKDISAPSAQQKKNPQMLQEQQLKQLKTKVPFKFRILQGILAFFTILILVVSIVQFYFNLDGVVIVKSYLEHSEYISNSLLYLVNIGYYSRMMQLASIYPSALPNFRQYRSNVTVFTDSLQKAQFWLANKETQYASKINFTYSQRPVSWQVSQQGIIFSKNETLSLNIFDLVTSSSSMGASTPAKFLFPEILTSDTSFASTNQYYRDLLRIRYSSLFELIPAKQKYTQMLYDIYCNKIEESFKISYVELGIACGIVFVFVIIYLKILSFILNSIFKVTTLFNLLNPQEIDKEIIRCETFLEHFFINSYEVVLRLNKNKILREPSFDEPLALANQKTNHNCLMKTGQYYADQETEKRQQNEGEAKNYMECTDEIDLVKISQKNLKEQIKGKEGGNAEDGPLLEKQSLDEQLDNQQEDTGLDMANLTILVPKVLAILFLLLYFVVVFFYNKISHNRTYIEVSNQNLLYHNIEGLTSLKYYGLELAVDPTAFKNYPKLSSYFQQISQNIYQHQQQLNQFGEVDTFEYPLQQLISNYNLHGICDTDFFASIGYSASSYSRDECISIDNGVLAEGYRAAIVAFIENIKNLTTVKSVPDLIASKSFAKAQLLEKYVLYPIERMANEDTKNSFSYLDREMKITIALFIFFVICVIVIAMLVSISTGKNLSERIQGTYQIISLIPQRIFQKNVNLCAEYRKNAKQLLE